MLTIPQILAQLPWNVTNKLPAEVDDFPKVITDLYNEINVCRSSVHITYDSHGWRLDVKVGFSIRCSSQGYWPTMRHACLATLLIIARPELPINGVSS